MTLSAFRRVIASLALLGAVACSTPPVPLGTHGTRPPSDARAREVRAQACGFQLMVLIPIRVNRRYERAYRALERQEPGALLTDVRVREKWFYGFAGTAYCTELTAQAYSSSRRNARH